MKKILRQNILRITSIAFLSFISVNTFAQQMRTSYFMKNSTFRTIQNPAFRPERGYVSLPVLGMINSSLSTNGLTYDNIVYPQGDNHSVLFLDPSVDANKFLNGLEKDNQINLDFNTQIFGAGWYSGKAFWNIDLTLRANVTSSLPKELFEFAKKGNGATGAIYNMNNIEVNSNAYLQTGIGYSRTINNRLTVGGKLKFLLGGASVKAKIDNLHAQLDGDAWNITSRGTVNVNGLNTKHDVDDEGQEYISGLNADNAGISGYGTGIDLGASYKLTDKITLSASLLDLGFISWKKGAYGEVNGKFKFDGFDLSFENSSVKHEDLSDQFDSMTDDLEELAHFTEKEQKSTTTFLTTTLNIGGEYELLKDKLSFGLLSTTRFYSPKAYTELTISTNYRPISWMEASLSYSSIHSNFKTFGAALNFSPCWINFFIGSDYILSKVTSEFIPINSTAADFYMGVSIPLGKKHK